MVLVFLRFGMVGVLGSRFGVLGSRFQVLGSGFWSLLSALSLLAHQPISYYVLRFAFGILRSGFGARL